MGAGEDRRRAMVDQRTIGQRLQSLRRGRFVGRAVELAWFEKVVAADRPEPCVVWVHGPGGIGKTSLCSRFADLARAAGRPVATVDARDVDLTREGLRAALGDPVPGQVTVIDTFERCAPLEAWLRESRLPSWPADGVVVLASRHPPSADWLADAGWQGLLRPVPLRNLRPKESRDFLRSRGVVGAQQDSAI